MRVVSGYRHRPGVHCTSAALRNVSGFLAGTEFSEAMCFGLGAGLNFTYVREYDTPFFLVMGRGSYMEGHFCDALHAQLELAHAEDPDSAWDHLRRCVDGGHLLMLDTDMFELPYMIQRLSLPTGTHFGGHKVLVVGYDEHSEEVLVADYAWSASKPLARKVLQVARNSRECPSRPRNAGYLFHFPDRLPPLEQALRKALATVVDQMRHPFMQYNGLPAIDRFCRQVHRWHLSMEPDALRRNYALTAFMLERAGTGGGAFRNLYGRFLREASQHLESCTLVQAAEVYLDLAWRWRAFARLLDAAAVDRESVLLGTAEHTAEQLATIAHLEHRGIALIEASLAEPLPSETRQ